MKRCIKTKILWNKVIHKQPGNYLGWPTIARKVDGELLVVFSGDREAHRCPYGKNQMIRSRDEGQTWSDVETINNSPLDDRDTGIVVLRSGTVVASWFTSSSRSQRSLEPYWEDLPPHTFDAWKRHVSKISDEMVQRWRGAWTRRSTDGGHTWEPAVNSIGFTPHGPIQLDDGRLLYIGTTMHKGKHPMVSVESVDEGRSWRQIGEIPVPKEHFEEMPYSEPHVVELPGGRLVSLWRFQPRARRVDRCICYKDRVGYCTCECDEKDQYMKQSESDDWGKTWTVTHETPMWGYPPQLRRLSGGDLMVVYGRRWPPRGERACLSHDGGATWDIENEIILRDDAPDGNLGYPASIELSPGELLTVYYQVERLGEKTSLMATRWSLRT